MKVTNILYNLFSSILTGAIEGDKKSEENQSDPALYYDWEKNEYTTVKTSFTTKNRDSSAWDDE